MDNKGKKMFRVFIHKHSGPEMLENVYAKTYIKAVIAAAKKWIKREGALIPDFVSIELLGDVLWA